MAQYYLHTLYNECGCTLATFMEPVANLNQSRRAIAKRALWKIGGRVINTQLIERGKEGDVLICEYNH